MILGEFEISTYMQDGWIAPTGILSKKVTKIKTEEDEPDIKIHRVLASYEWIHITAEVAISAHDSILYYKEEFEKTWAYGFVDDSNEVLYSLREDFWESFVSSDVIQCIRCKNWKVSGRGGHFCPICQWEH